MGRNVKIPFDLLFLNLMHYCNMHNIELRCQELRGFQI